jgi:alkylation response protein AidB-like acyl-CoA dehydrogenase
MEEINLNLEFSEKEEAFRIEVREFIAANYPEKTRAAQNDRPEFDLPRDEILDWQKVLAKKGWAAPAWPAEWGGTDWTPTQHLIFTEELARAEAVFLVPFGLAMLAPVLWTYGTEEQKKRFLPDIYYGVTWWCQGYSEPGAGSDLASLRTTAERVTDPDGSEYYLVNGQKTWTTMGQHADWGFFLVRTDPKAKKPQMGISFLLIDMKSEGITMNPIITVEGEHEVNDIFLENVKVPIENRVHEENKGWDCAKALLAHERTAIANVARSRVCIQKLKKIAAKELGDDGKPLLEDPAFLRKITTVEVDLEALAMTELRVVAASAAGKGPGPESSILKVRGTEIEQRISELAVEAVGYEAMPYITTATDNSNDVLTDYAVGATYSYLNNRKLSIFGGSNEIQRNIISKVVLGL